MNFAHVSVWMHADAAGTDPVWQQGTATFGIPAFDHTLGTANGSYLFLERLHQSTGSSQATIESYTFSKASTDCYMR